MSERAVLGPVTLSALALVGLLSAGSARADDAPPPEDASARPLNMGVWGRIGNVLNDPRNPRSLGDVGVNGEIDLVMGGQVHRYFKWQANFVATYGPGVTGSANIMDLIGEFEPTPYFNLWFGRHLVPSDRSNFSGPFFMAPWTYPGSSYIGGSYVGPKQGPFGRSDGVTAWGMIRGGFLKYYLSVLDLQDALDHPLYTGRVAVSLLEPEPGYYNASTYYGKDILSFGVSAQFKKDGSVQAVTAVPGMPAPVALTADYRELTLDGLYEKKLPKGGVFDVEASFYLYGGSYEAFRSSWFVLASYLTAQEFWIGKLQPLIRFQQAKPSGASAWNLIEAQVGYVVKGYAARAALMFAHGDLGGKATNAIYLGLQLQK